MSTVVSSQQFLSKYPGATVSTFQLREQSHCQLCQWFNMILTLKMSTCQYCQQSMCLNWQMTVSRFKMIQLLPSTMPWVATQHHRLSHTWRRGSDTRGQSNRRDQTPGTSPIEGDQTPGASPIEGIRHQGPVQSKGIRHQGPVQSKGSDTRDQSNRRDQTPGTSPIEGIRHQGPVQSKGIRHQGPVQSKLIFFHCSITSNKAFRHNDLILLLNFFQQQSNSNAHVRLSSRVLLV